MDFLLISMAVVSTITWKFALRQNRAIKSIDKCETLCSLAIMLRVERSVGDSTLFSHSELRRSFLHI